MNDKGITHKVGYASPHVVDCDNLAQVLHAGIYMRRVEATISRLDASAVVVDVLTKLDVLQRSETYLYVSDFSFVLVLCWLMWLFTSGDWPK